MELYPYQKRAIKIVCGDADRLYIAGSRRVGITTCLVEICKRFPTTDISFITIASQRKMVDRLVGRRVSCAGLPIARRDLVIIDNAAHIPQSFLKELLRFESNFEKFVIATTAPLSSSLFCHAFLKADTKLLVRANNIIPEDVACEYFGAAILAKFDKLLKS